MISDLFISGKLEAVLTTEGGKKLGIDAVVAATQNDPENTLEILARYPDLTFHGVSLKVFINNNPKEADFWYEKNKGDLSVDSSNEVSAAFANYAGSEGAYDKAWEWAEAIENPALKEQVEGRIWSSERRKVLSDVRSDPSGVLDKIVSGESIHAEYWIKDAFDQWRTADSANAVAWYEENRKTLTPSQNQHVARAYVEQALDSGDLDTANQWLGQVTEEKFRDALIKQIEKAEDGK